MNRKKSLLLGLVLIVLLAVWLFCFKGQKEKKINDQTTTETAIETESEAMSETGTKAEAENIELTERLEKIKQTEAATLVVENVLAQGKESVEVRVFAVNNPGIVGMTMILSYDEDVLSLKSAKNGSEFRKVLSLSRSKDMNNGCVFLWTGKTLTEEQIFDGVLMTMEFEIKDGEKNIKTPIRLLPEVGGTYDNDLNEVELVIDNGYVTVIRE